MALSLIWWVLSSLFGGGDDDQITAVPQNPSSLATPGAPATPSASVQPSGSPAASGSAARSGSAAPSGSAAASASGSASPAVSVSASASGSANAKPSSTSKPTPSAPLNCAAADLEVELSGAAAVTIGKPTTITVKTTNSSANACTIALAETPLSLAITSGVDPIWSSDHCAKWAPSGNELLEPGQAWSWQYSWATKRSRAECVLRPDVLKAGTYRATASYKGGRADTLVMNLRN